MKKLAVAALIFIAIAGVSVQDLSAQTDISWNWGVVTDKNFSFKPFLWTTGLSFDFYLNPNLSFTPEIYSVIHNFDFGTFILAPALMLNFQGENFFAGGGLTKLWLLGSEIEGGPSSDVAFKANVGFKGYDIKFTLFAVTPFNQFFKDMVLGAAFGFYF